jgi:sec-independent protein translocase protein TatC
MARRPTEADLFAEEQSMPAMSFGDHIEELRARLILGLLGLVAGVCVAFIPVPTPWGTFTLGQWVFDQMQRPAQAALNEFYDNLATRRETEADRQELITKPFTVQVPAEEFAAALRSIFPDAPPPAAASLKGKTIAFPLIYKQSDWIEGVHRYAERKKALMSLAPLETFMIFFMVCMVTGLVVASPWVFYQVWTFIAAGLYRHERYYVMKFLPFSLGLFLGGVMLCFFYVLPFTLKFLLDFNVWLDVEPSLRIKEWMSFATVLPLIFGLCFQTPLVMMVLERIGVFTAEDYRAKRKIALLVIVIAAAAITPTGDPMTMMLLAGPMYGLYELGIRLIPARKEDDVPGVLSS